MEIIETETANGQYDLSAGIRCMSPKRRVRTRIESANIFFLKSTYLARRGSRWGCNRSRLLSRFKATNTIIYVYLLSMETDIFGNSLSRNTTDARNDCNSHTNRLMTNIGLGINNIYIRYSLSRLQHFRLTLKKKRFNK